MGACKLINLNKVNYIADYEIESEYYYNQFYTVRIKGFNRLHTIKSSCSCLYKEKDLCKHQVAALYHLEKELGYIDVPNMDEEEEGGTILYMKVIEEEVIRQHISKRDWGIALNLAIGAEANIVTNNEQEAKTTLSFEEEAYDVIIQKIGLEEFALSCTCTDRNNYICVHEAAFLLKIKATKGADAFDFMRDWNEHKNNLLKPYGFTTDDNLEGRFKFVMGKKVPELKVLDPSIVKLSEINSLTQKYDTTNPADKLLLIPGQAKNNNTDKNTHKNDKYGIGYVLDTRDKTYMPYFDIVPVMGKLNSDETGFTANVAPIVNDYGHYEIDRLPIVEAEDLAALKLVKGLNWKNVGDFARNRTRAKVQYTWNNNGGYYVQDKDLSGIAQKNIQVYIVEQLKALFQLLNNKRVYIIKDTAKSYANRNLLPLNLAETQANLCFKLEVEEEFMVLTAMLKANDEKLLLYNAEIIGQQMLLNNDTLYLIDLIEDLDILKVFGKKTSIKINKKVFPSMLTSLILPLKKRYELESNIDFDLIEVEVEPELQVYLKEDESFMIIQPVLLYNDKQVELDKRLQIIYEQDDTLFTIKRIPEKEQAFGKFIQNLHPNFKEQVVDTEGLFYYISYDDVIVDNWFLTAFEEIKQAGIELFGFKNLTKFNYNVNKPTIDLRVSSGIDWFDMEADIRYGDQTASLKDVQKALIRKEKFVRLNDGSLGVMPNEWLNKYASLFKMSTIKGSTLQVSKLHFSLIDDLYEQIDEEDVKAELDDKRQKLKSFTHIQKIPLPKNVSATLRPYQTEGYNWFNFLNDFRWGGCLADDMGLGKTLQVLTFLQALKEKNGPSTNLVVVPTSLIFNWEAEIEKFCNDLTVYRHHGSTRLGQHQCDIFNDYDVVITSYGTLSSDIEMFTKFTFNYVVLDESQAIKNPTTKRYKAVRLIKAHNRLALTGTPIENNTFDLYAQLNFLNPGILGSMEFFKKEFANPIDKHGSEEKAKELRKIVYPFLLRRTKEMVADDLPEKTEMVLYCEMSAKQRHVYDTFKEVYRQKIMKHIEEDGMSKSGMYILEGLMKLRQICDSPALLKDAEDYGTDSVKLNEIEKHITEKTGNHKILVFSQFLGMLAMIREKIEAQGIDFEYLDGSASPKARQASVNRFQNEKNCRVFLISLKAGGLGLNLTAADYVFLIDPWWNPAVEQQAIDRSHRIGQKNHVFAYKMICTNSVEEKILKLQDKKKAIAEDIVSTEKSFLKSLSEKDVAYLFS